MGAGSSAVTTPPASPQGAAEPGAAGTPELAEQENGSPSSEAAAAAAAPESPGDPATSAAPGPPKLLQKNGQISSIHGIPEEQGEDPHEEEAVVLDVGQRDPENMIEKDEVDDTLAARPSSSVQDVQETVPEVIEQMPLSENSIEEPAQPTESQSNDVGFKKVFKFVGFKFTVKKDKNDKSDPVELLTVKKDEDDNVETNGAEEHQDFISENETLLKETEATQVVGADEECQRDSGADPLEGKSSEEEKQEKGGNKSSETESVSSFKKFFSLGWAGWRKKTSFRKSKEEKPEISEKKKEQEVGKEDVIELDEGKKEDTGKQSTISEHLPPQEAIESIKDSSVFENEKVHSSPEDQVQEAHTSSEEKVAPLATEVFDEKVETVAEVHVSTVEEQEQTEDPTATVEHVGGSLFLATAEVNEDLQKVEVTEKLVKTRELVCASGDDYVKQVEPSPEQSALCHQHEGITNEVEILSSQERGRLQGSPLKKLFTGTGLKKLSGKKYKGKRGEDEIKLEESGELTEASVDSPETPEEQKGESSASSPEELTEVTTCVEKSNVEAPQEAEIEEECPTSDGERKRDGVTPWASFKKMVTPKKRVRRLSESDKEEEVEKVKSATLSSTESAVSDNQEEMRGHGDDQKTEEPKRKVDASVSWEALICVGSSKKRARKSSSSDEEGSKVIGGDSQKTEDVGKNKDSGTEITHMHSHEGDQGQINSSPELAGSPLEGEGVSTWVSFKRLVTPRKKSKSKMEERNEDSLEHSASDAEPVKEESWVSIKKLIPGRRKKRLDGKQEQVPVEEDYTGVNEDDSDIPAVVPLSEYDAAEQEKIEAQGAKNTEAAKTSLHEMKSGQVEGPATEEAIEELVHAVTVTVVEGERAVTSIEERSPSWISAKITELVEEAIGQPKEQAEEIHEKEVLVEIPITKTLPDIKDTSSDTIVSELELTSEAVTAPEEAVEITEASYAEETTEMVSAVSQLTDTPDSTVEATPVQEVEDDTPDLEALQQRTQEVIQAVIEKVKQSEESEITATVVSGDTLLADQSIETKITKRENVKKDEQSGDHQDMKVEIGEAAAGLDDSKVVYAEEQEQVQAAKSEVLTSSDRQQEIIEPVSSETFNKFNEVERNIEVTEYKSYSDFTTYQAETSGVPMEQTIKQQEGSDVGDSVPALGTEIIETTVVTVSSDEPLGSPNKEQSKIEVPVPTEEQIVVHMVQSFSGTEVVQDSGPLVNQEMKNTITAKEQVSLDTEMMEQTKIDQIELKDVKVTEDKLEHKNSSEKIQLQMEGEVLVQEQTVSLEALQVQSSETQGASSPLTAAEEQKVPSEVFPVQNSETQESLPSTVAEEQTVSSEVLKVQSSETQASLPLTTVEEQKESSEVLPVQSSETQESLPSTVAEEQTVSSEVLKVQSSETQASLPLTTVEEQKESSEVLPVQSSETQESLPSTVAEEQTESSEVLPVQSSETQECLPSTVAEEQTVSSEVLPVQNSETQECLPSTVAEEQTVSSVLPVQSSETQESLPLTAAEEQTVSSEVLPVQGSETQESLPSTMAEEQSVSSEVLPVQSSETQESLPSTVAAEQTVSSEVLPVQSSETQEASLPLTAVEEQKESLEVLKVQSSETQEASLPSTVVEEQKASAEVLPVQSSETQEASFPLTAAEEQKVSSEVLLVQSSETQASLPLTAAEEQTVPLEVLPVQSSETEASLPLTAAEEQKVSLEVLRIQSSETEASLPLTAAEEQTVTLEVLPIQSSETQEASLPLKAAAVVEKAVAEAVKLSETADENLDSVNVQLVTEKMSSESIQDSDTAVFKKKQSLTEPTLEEKAKNIVLLAITETIESSDLMKRPGKESQKLSDAASVDVVSQEVKPTLTQVEPGKDEDGILTIKTQSTRIVENVIQTAVDQLASAKDLNTQTLAFNSEDQAQIRKTEEEDTIHLSEEEGTIHVSERNESELIVQCEVKSVTTENLGPVAVEPTQETPVTSGIYTDASISEGSETIAATEVQTPELKLGEQRHAQLEEKKEAIETECEPEIGSMMSEKVHEPQGDTEDDTAIDHSDDPKLVPGESNDLWKESIDSNGPKLKETVQGLECQERLVRQVEDTKTQTQEEVHEHDEPCESPPESAPQES